jgi:cellulose synthase (UDP-forming)
MVVQWGMVARFGLLAGLTLLGMLYGSLADYAPERQSAASTGIVLFWSCYNIVVLLLAMAACVELPRYRGEERLATSEPVRISTVDGPLVASLQDLSISGASVLALPPGRSGDVVTLDMDGVGELAGRIVRRSEMSFAVEFLHSDGSRDALIRKLYSGRYYDRPRSVPGGRLFRAVVARALR